jgi:hypothetical protein
MLVRLTLGCGVSHEVQNIKMSTVTSFRNDKGLANVFMIRPCDLAS